ncbi:CbiQ family ECF transporter T component [Methylobacillus flagellatus]|uniref:CbiQ family ECF transporter T component n=1 Tax=Methylobacillus flagellatus TaxID=405 RepID=UPI00257087A9|nr:CbiQ family ECF transporter T component [Methylobacillus flagellatus]
MLMAIAVADSDLAQLLLLAAPVAVWLYFGSWPRFVSMLRRSRLLLLSLLLIYAWTTPGEYLPGWPLWLAPSYEGLAAGGLQLLRLALMLAALSLLLQTTSREQFIAGLLQLASPLRFIGLDPQRFAARLWLTLHYLEQMPPRQSLQLAFAQLQAPPSEPQSLHTIHLQLAPWRKTDTVLLLLGVILTALVCVL